MTQNPTTMLKMMYSGSLEYISCPAETTYEDILEIAIERFNIPTDFKDFIQISNESRYVFEKETFEYFIFLFPNPEIIFCIRIDYAGLLDSFRMESRKPFAKLNNKRQRSDDEDEVIGVPVTRQNCFFGSLPGNNTSTDEPETKRSRNEYIRSRVRVVKKNSLKKSIRI